MKEKYKSIDIVRGIAIIMVILCHFQQNFSRTFEIFAFGQMGCQIFFVVSGFCLTNSYLNNPVGILQFYKKRLKSIVPGFYFSLLLEFIIRTAIVFIKSGTMTIGEEYRIFPILCNLLLIHGLFPFLNTLLGGAWYIGTIAILYLIFPIIIKLIKKIKINPIIICTIISLFSVGMLAVASYISCGAILVYNNTYKYFLFLNQLPCFCIGISLYYIINDAKNKFLIFKNDTLLIIAFLFLGVLSGAVFFFCDISVKFIILPTLVGLFSASLIGLMMRFEMKYNFNNKFIKIIEAFGRKSFYLFLAHGFVIWRVSKYLINVLEPFGINTYVLFFVLLFIMLWLSWVIAVALEKFLQLFNRNKSIKE